MKRGNHSRSRSSKALVLVLALVLIVGAVIGTTLAYLTDTESVKNTFTVGNIEITLTETTGAEYKMIPGQPITKNPVVTVDDTSEACWLFVKMDEAITPQTTDSSYSGGKSFDDFLTYTMADGWIELDATNHPGVYYREVTDSDVDQPFVVLKDDTVSVLPEVTKAMMDHLTNANANPTLTVTAYAIQKAGFNTAAAAWKAYNDQNP